MKNPFAATLIAVFALTVSAVRASDNDTTRYPDIPRIDVHAHVAENWTGIANYLVLRGELLEAHGADLAMWINLGNSGTPVPDQQKVLDYSKGRILTCISDYSSHNGMEIPPADLAGWMEKGYVGYKIWAGPPHRRLDPDQEGFPYVDDPALDATFAEMERIGMVGASVHVADPNGPVQNRTRWLPDPVEYWKQILAWRRVMERHPNLRVVNAHGMWAVCQDAQIDYLRNALSTFPNLHVDLAATFQYYSLVTRENLRDFMIEYADRVLFGTDIGSLVDPEQAASYAERYFRCFGILETDGTVEGGFFGGEPVQGLALPREALEKIYYKNAMRVYPRVRVQMARLGYCAD